MKDILRAERFHTLPSPCAIPMHGEDNGFSLVEMLVVLAMTGILLGISAWTLSRYLPYSNLKRAARTTISLCQLARQEAIKRNTRVAAVFSNATQSVAVFLSPGADGNWLTETDNVLLRRFPLQDLPGQVRFGFGTATKKVTGEAITSTTSPLPPGSRFVFNPRGGVAGSLGTVYLHDAAGNAMAITTRSLSGALLVRQWSGTTWSP